MNKSYNQAMWEQRNKEIRAFEEMRARAEAAEAKVERLIAALFFVADDEGDVAIRDCTVSIHEDGWAVFRGGSDRGTLYADFGEAVRHALLDAKGGDRE